MTQKTQFSNGGANDASIFNRYYMFPGVIGNAWFANSAGSLGAGYSPDAPFTTLAGAVAAATALNGDVIYLAPGHAEAIIAAAQINVNVAGLRIQGLGVGRNRPTFTFGTSTAAQIIVSGANVTFSNCIFDFTGLDAIVAAISVTGADVAFEDCEFITNSATAGVVKGILTAATATRFRVERCRFLGQATNTGTTTTAQIDHEVGVDYLIKQSYFSGKMTQSILNATTVLRGLITDNDFVIATGTVAITMAAGSTPLITKNRINVPSGTAPIVAAAGFCAANMYSAAAGVTAGAALTF